MIGESIRWSPGRVRAWLVRVAVVALPLTAMSPKADAMLIVSSTDLKELTVRSDAIGRYRVSHAVSRWVNGRIETEADAEAVERLKGGSAGVVRVIAPGGVVNGIGMHVNGSPTFHDGDDAFLFLTKDAKPTDGPPAFHLASALGKIDIVKDVKLGKDVVEWANPDLGRVDRVPATQFADQVVRYARVTAK